MVQVPAGRAAVISCMWVSIRSVRVVVKGSPGVDGTGRARLVSGGDGGVLALAAGDLGAGRGQEVHVQGALGATLGEALSRLEFELQVLGAESREGGDVAGDPGRESLVGGALVRLAARL